MSKSKSKGTEKGAENTGAKSPAEMTPEELLAYAEKLQSEKNAALSVNQELQAANQKLEKEKNEAGAKAASLEKHPSFTHEGKKYRFLIVQWQQPSKDKFGSSKLTKAADVLKDKEFLAQLIAEESDLIEEVKAEKK